MKLNQIKKTMRETVSFLRSRIKYLLLICIAILLGVWSCSDDTGDEESIYDPTKPAVLNSFYPDSGKYEEQVILSGSNFGNKAENINVYFNNAKAAVIGTDGKQIYVQVPRLPGDTCLISVVIGEDSLCYEKKFLYHKSVTVTTIAGNGNGHDYVDGDLTSSILKPKYICVDKEGNIFIIVWNDDRTVYSICRIDEEDNELITIKKDIVGNVPCADPTTGIITIPTEATQGSFLTLDPDEMWAPRIREMKYQDLSKLPLYGWKHCMVVNPDDGYIYAQYYTGELVKINAKSYSTEVINTNMPGDCYGMTFSPLHPNLLYLSFYNGQYANCIYTINVTAPDSTFQRIAGATSGGHRDGPLDVAEFRQPSQMFCDNDGNIYIADFGNSCIRRITPDGMVETVLGMPGTAGWKDGTKDEALFNNPTGIGIGIDGSVYVADFGNSRVRKLSIN